MQQNNPQLHTTVIRAAAAPPAIGLLSDAEVKHLCALHDEFNAQIRQAIRDGNEKAVRGDIRKLVEERLNGEDHPRARAWGWAVANDHIRRDAMYQVMLDWVDEWVVRAEEGKLPDGFSNITEKGRGGMGVVFQADWEMADGCCMAVALKLPFGRRHGDQHGKGHERDTLSGTQAVGPLQLFVNEVRQLMKAPLRNCVQIRGASLPPPGLEIDALLDHLHHSPICFWMQLVDGESLRNRLGEPASSRSDATLNNETILYWMVELATGLYDLHRAGIFHRDLKPENILIDKEGRPWLTDFGLAIPRLEQLSTGNPVAGTEQYMAPEQLDGEEVSEQTDIWSWGVVFFELLYGYPPFLKTDPRETRSKLHDRIRKGEFIVPDRNPKVPNVWLQIIKKCLTPNRKTRPNTFRYILEMLGHPLRDNRQPGRRVYTRNDLPQSYQKVAQFMQDIMPHSDGTFPRSMLSNIEAKLAIADAVIESLAPHVLWRHRLFFAMSTTCHVLFEKICHRGWIAERDLDIHTSNLPLLLSAQALRVNCNVYGSYLVHEYASLTFTRSQTTLPEQRFDHVFIGARGVARFGNVLEIRTCKEEHEVLLRQVMACATQTIVILFDASKLECADGRAFIQLVPTINLTLQPGVRVLLAVEEPDYKPASEQPKYYEFARDIFAAGFRRDGKVGNVCFWKLVVALPSN